MDGTQAANQLVLNLGQAADTASITGTANAKLQYLIANLLGVEPAVVIGRSLIANTYATSSATLQNALSLSGKGSLQACALVNSSGSNVSPFALKITVDGTVVVSGSGGTINNSGTAWVIPGTAGGYSFATSGYGFALDIEYKTSLLIQCASDGTHSLSCNWLYAQ